MRVFYPVKNSGDTAYEKLGSNILCKMHSEKKPIILNFWVF